MRENRLRARQKRRRKRTTDSLHAFPIAPNTSGPGLRSGRADQKMRRLRHLLRVDPRGLALPRRRHRPVRPARRRLGNQRSASQGTGIVGSAPGHRRAASGRRPHSPRGPRQPILLPRLQAELRKNGILISMSGKGNCFDNAMVETFFKTLKAELVWRTVFRSRTEATTAMQLCRRSTMPSAAIRRSTSSARFSSRGRPRKLENALRKCGARGSERRIAPKALDKFKGRIRDITRRTRGFSLQQLIKELKPYIVGWRGYFGFCQTPRVLTNLEAWIRRRLRLYLWRQWRTRQNRFAELRRRGVAKFPAAVAAGSPTGLWRMSGHPAVQQALRNAYFESLGLPRIGARPSLTRSNRRGTGPVCPVVWEGWRREASPYPDQCQLSGA